MLFPIIWCVLLCLLLWTSIRTFKNVAFLSLSKQISEGPVVNQGDWEDFTTDQASSDGPPVHVYNRPKFKLRPSISWTDSDAGPRLSFWNGRVDGFFMMDRSPHGRICTTDHTNNRWTVGQMDKVCPWRPATDLTVFEIFLKSSSNTVSKNYL